MDVIILSGGMGTRLQNVVKNVPKTMAPINGLPFLEYTFKYLSQFDVENIILAVGYKKEIIEEYFKNQYGKMNIIYSEEDEPLGTGGALKKALAKTAHENVIVMNGDIYTHLNIAKLYEQHISTNVMTTLSLKMMKNFDRFGVVKFNKDKNITEFKEKEYTKEGYINVGIYAMNKNIFNGLELGNKFSLENDYLKKIDSNGACKAYLYRRRFYRYWNCRRLQ